MAETIGLECKAYRNTGTWGSPTWVLMGTINMVSIKIGRNLVAISNRASEWEKVLAGLLKGDFELKFTRDNTDASQLALRDAVINKTTVGLALSDGPIASSGSVYAKADVLFGDCNDEEGL